MIDHMDTNIITRDNYWQRIRGCCILAVIFIHCQSGADAAIDSFNGFSYFIIRNLVNFPVNIFFFMSGFFVKPIDDNISYYKNRLPKLVLPYFLYSAAFMAIRIISGSTITVRTIISAVFLGTAATPLYYIVVLIYFTLLTPVLIKALNNRMLTVLVFLSTPICLLGSYILYFFGHDFWVYLKYSPVWLSFYFLGMFLKKNSVAFNKALLWILLPIAYISELASTFYLMRLNGFNAYTQLRFSGAFYSVVIALLLYEYSKKRHNAEKADLLSRLGDDSFGIFFMHCAFTRIFVNVIQFKEKMPLVLYEAAELVFAVVMCEIAIFVIRKIISNNKTRMIFGV